MRGKFPPMLWLLALSLLLTGCGSSPPNNYYVLSAQEFPIANGDTPAIGVGPIEVPEYLIRQNLVYNHDENTLHIFSLDLWGEPLEDGIQRVMALNLSGLLHTQNMRFFPWNPQRAPDYGVKVNLLQLDANENEAMIKAEWLVYRPTNGESVKRRISQLKLPLPSGASEPEQVAEAYSKLLLQLSEIIAADIKEDQAAQ
ncbi:membrane integrity-associated transporter subunit PqiC [Halioglobus sp. Uisw_031]|uniref:PqiC family protein n=1 Tax=Halioglobus sp. Uisw_031 TaxID=3230977 RepID=UPI0039E9B1F4